MSEGHHSTHDDAIPSPAQLSRRRLIQAAGATAFAAAAAPALAQAPANRPSPPTTITTPPRDFSRRGAPTTYFWDPDVIAVDPSFNNLAQPNAAIQRLWTGGLWLEGPAWNAQGRYLVWSDIPRNRQMRWIEDDGNVSVFRMPSGYSNGNSFDFQGRQLSCEHLNRRVVRYELDGSATVLADSFEGKKLNSPNDIVAHPDGSYWFTDPPYGGQLYEGAPDAAGGPSNASGKINPRLGQPPGIGLAKRELPTNVYRLDPGGRLDLARQVREAAVAVLVRQVDGEDRRAVGSLPAELRLDRLGRAGEPAPEDRRVDPEAVQDLRHLREVAERVGDVADAHRLAEAPADLPAEQHVADRRLAADEELVGQDVPGADLDAPRLDEAAEVRLALGPDLEVILEDDGLAVEHEEPVVRIGVHQRDQPVDEPDQLPAELLERPVPLAVPVSVRDDVNLARLSPVIGHLRLLLPESLAEPRENASGS